MTVEEVITLLASHQDARGQAYWAALYPDSHVVCYGVGLTRLRQLAKKIGRDHDLALRLWERDIYEAKVMALLLDEPKRITREQAERQVEQLQGGQLVHVFSSCDAALAKVPYVVELAEDWIRSDDPVRKSCAYGLIYELSKSTKKDAPTDARFEAWLARIDREREGADVNLLMAMAGALLGVGKRNARLNAPALRIARAIGPIDFDDRGKCEPFEVVKHLDNARLRAKLGITG